MGKKFDKTGIAITTFCLSLLPFLILDFFYEKVCENLIDVKLSKNLARECLYK
jgi:hypothetical protein